MNIRQKIEGKNFKDIELKKYYYNEYEYECIIAKMFQPSIATDVISDYYFIKLDANNAIPFVKDYKLNNFKKFQKQILSKTFYDYKSDLRWNLYLVFVFSRKNDKDLIKQIPYYDIENNDEFARKIFIEYGELDEFLEKDKIYSKALNQNNKEPINPVVDWWKILDEKGLTGVLFEEKLMKNIELYLDGKKITSKNKIKQDEKKQLKDKIIKHINKVTGLNTFRTHCFSSINEIYPGLINLIHGPNGSGKTSIIEGIEFAITNTTKKSELLQNYSESGIVQVECKTNTLEDIVLKSNKSNNTCKQLDKIWYNTPIIGKEKKIPFNNNFGHYNYFNSESAYTYAMEESRQQNDYEGIFSNIIFGEKVTEAEKRWMWYYDNFQKVSENILKEIERLRSEKENIQKELEKYKKKKTLKSDKVEELLKRIKFKNHDFKHEVILEKYKMIYETFDKLEDRMIKVRNGLTSKNVDSILAINDLISDYNKEITECNDNINKLNTNIINYQKNIESLIVESEKIDEEIEKDINEKEEYLATMNEWNEVKRIILNNDKFIEYKEIIKNNNILLEKKNNLKHAFSIYSKIIDLSENDVNILNLQDYKKINSLMKIKSLKIQDINKNISIIESDIIKVQQLKIDLKSLGEKIINISKNDNVCPFCGTLFDNYNTLADKITNNFKIESINDNYLYKLKKEKDELSDEVIKISKQISIENEKRINHELLMKCAEYINQCGIDKINLNQDISKILSSVKESINSLHEITKEIENNKFIINNYLQNYSFYEDIIERSEKFMRNRIYRQFIRKGSVIKFEGFLNKKIDDLIKKLSLNRQILEKNKKNIEIWNGRKERISDRIATKKESKNESNELLLDCKDLLKNIQILKDYFVIVSNTNIIELCNYYEKVVVALNILISQLTNNLKNEELNNKISDNEKKNKVLGKRFKRCNEALASFHKMKKLSNYSREFITENETKIKYIFRSLHRPKEFSNIKFGDHEIIITREYDNKEIGISQMSTGQRISLALSVMLSMYLAAPNVPMFLLLDEPVANMDDLHVLNLLDILRDIATTGTQIFFTTANPDVAGLFRRKFSFFGSQFRHFEISRKDEGASYINIYKYSYDSEDRIDLSNVS